MKTKRVATGDVEEKRVVSTEKWIARNEQRILSLLREVYPPRLWPDGTGIENVRGFMRTLHQGQNVEGILMRLKDRGFIKWDVAGNHITLTQKGQEE